MDENKIIEEFKSWKGTKWVHGQSCKGAGADCIQFIITGYKNLGLLPKEFKNMKYNRDYALHNKDSVLLTQIAKYCKRVGLGSLKIGDILIYRYDATPHHAAVYVGDNKIIHSKIRSGIVESYLSDEEKYFVSAWRLGVLD